MAITIKTRRLGAGSYDIDTPSGTYQLKNCPVDASDPFMVGFRRGPRWMLTNPGEYSADNSFDTKRDAIESIRTNEQRKADQANQTTEETPVTTATTSRFVVNQLGFNNFVVRDTATELDAATSTSCYGAQHIADCLTDGTMVLDMLGRAIPAQAPTVSTATDAGEFGVFNEDGDCIEGPYWHRSKAEQAAQGYRDEDEDGEYTVRDLCPDHEGHAKDGCAECYEDEN